MNTLLEKIIDVAPLLRNLLQMDFAISISDTEKYLALFETDTLKFPFSVGDSVRASGYGQVLDHMAKTGESVTNFVSKEVTGTVPIKAIISPIVDNKTVVGYFSISINREKESQIDETFLKLVTSIQAITKSTNELNDRMHSIEEEFKTVESNIDSGNKAIQLIHGISKQTNLLSLNASIEAARVGAVGAGFSIVAKEMGKLSTESKNVSDNVEESFKAIDSSVNHSMKKLMEAKELSNTQNMKANEISNTINAILQNTK